MKPIYAELNNNSVNPLYIQLYDYIRGEIENGAFDEGERLPSLRALASQLGVSVTTCAKAYDQLLLEGYLESKPQSGYYVQKVGSSVRQSGAAGRSAHINPGNSSGAAYGHAQIQTGTTGNMYSGHMAGKNTGAAEGTNSGAAGRRTGAAEEKNAGSTGNLYRCDPDSFDFGKWRKCFTWVMNENAEALLAPQDPQGEYALRSEISGYLYTSRGVVADPADIVISAGVQQLMTRLVSIMKKLGIDFVSVEDPGYKPVRHMFRDLGLTLNKVNVADDGIEIERLPQNIRSAVYVSPSNQFPTGSVMPVARRNQLLEWAAANDSLIIEDDYDSELRYFGNPVPALKSMDVNGLVVYLGSFSSTLFPAIRISYMVLPEMLSRLYAESKSEYDQTCSKIEQLVLAEYMKNGFYQTGIRKMRKLYARKLDRLLRAFTEYGGNTVSAKNTRSGISLRLNVRSEKTSEELCDDAGELQLHIEPVENGAGAADGKGSKIIGSIGGDDSSKVIGAAGGSIHRLIMYYDQIPIDEIDSAVKDICARWMTGRRRQ